MKFRIGFIVAASLISQIGFAGEHEVDPRIFSTDAFLGAHPDLRWRLRGLEKYQKGEYDEAFKDFRRAARYADKPAQAMVAEMLWKGEGTKSDRALAYAWMDLAAEREYPTLAVFREQYWAQLTPEEQKQALEIGKAVYAEYRDSVAKPRLESQLRNARSDITGSRTGMTGGLKIYLPSPTGELFIEGREFFDPRFWDPKQYWQWASKGWTELPKARVTVGPLTAEPAADPKKKETEKK
jgi:hypothetical protein